VAREQEKKRRTDQSPNKRSHAKVQNAQWGALRGENTKPISSSKKLAIPGISSDTQ